MSMFLEPHGKDSSKQKGRFLRLFVEKKTIARALKELKISRFRFNRWLQEDEKFCHHFEISQGEIDDNVEEIMLKKIGVIPMESNAEAAHLKGWADNKLVTEWLQMRRYRRNDKTVQNLTLNISGLDMGKLAQLAAPKRETAERIPVDVPAVVSDEVKDPELDAMDGGQ